MASALAYTHTIPKTFKLTKFKEQRTAQTRSTDTCYQDNSLKTEATFIHLIMLNKCKPQAEQTVCRDRIPRIFRVFFFTAKQSQI